MKRRKLRTMQHIMEEDSIQLIKQTLPMEWVIERYTVDYGIDLRIEVFEDIKGSGNEALGEFILAQVKSVSHTVIKKRVVNKRRNVAKGPISCNNVKERNSEQIDVFAYSLDTSTILTVKSMGAAIPVFLLYVTLDTRKLYFVNLTDYIEKVLIPEDPDFDNKRNKTIYIPLRNEVTSHPIKYLPLRFAATRMKLYAFFHKVSYQKKTIIDNFVGNNVGETARFLKQIIFLLDDIRLNDIWEYTGYWGGLEVCYERMHELYSEIKTSLNILNNSKTMGVHQGDINHVTSKIYTLWDNFITLGHVYEEVIRERHLPTVLANILDE